MCLSLRQRAADCSLGTMHRVGSVIAAGLAVGVPRPAQVLHERNQERKQEQNQKREREQEQKHTSTSTH